MTDFAPPSYLPRVPDDASVLDRFRDVMAAAGYTESGLREALGAPAGFALRSPDLGLHLRGLSSHGALAPLARLFLIGAAVEEELAATALAPLRLAPLVSAGLLERRDGRMRSPVCVIPCEDLLVVCDRDERASDPDYVTGVVPASMTLAYLTVRRPAETALDLGTGSGIQALLAARHSAEVTALDANPRSLGFAALNARLNRVPNVSVQGGSWFEPVIGRRFDLIVSNPPYVVSPDSGLIYRDSGLPGDALCRRIVTETPDHLNEDGFGHILCNWIHAAGGDPSGPVRAWVEDSGCDALVLHYASDDPLSYAATWNQPLQDKDPVAYEQALGRWLTYYEENGIEAIAAGCVVLRRRSQGPNWVRSIEAPAAPSGHAGEHLERLFVVQDYLARLGSDRDLLDEAFRPVEGHRLDQCLTYRNGEYVAAPAVMRVVPGAGLEGQVAPEAMEVVLACDGRSRLRDLIAEVADARGADRDRLADSCLEAIRGLTELGFLVPGAIARLDTGSGRT